ncbi:MAG: hypothetical protein K9G46_02670 [Flavobacteriales bacterium]|nr:hypothetical protein [Flavobacteriales bacterium]
MDNYEERDSAAQHEDEFDEVEYSKGFNWGFVIGEHNPSLAKDLMDSLEPDDGRASGLIEGFREFFREKEHDRMSDLENLRNRGRNFGREI